MVYIPAIIRVPIQPTDVKVDVVSIAVDLPTGVIPFALKETTSTRSPRKKPCAKCKERKELKDFPKHTTSSDGHAAYCRDCKNALAKLRRLNDPIARLKHYTVTRIKNEFDRSEVPADVHTNLEGYLGYKLHSLKRALQDDIKAREGISLIESFKREYHLDHIKPMKSFGKHKIGDETFRACWAISNLRMIPKTDNLKKGSKYDG